MRSSLCVIHEKNATFLQEFSCTLQNIRPNVRLTIAHLDRDNTMICQTCMWTYVNVLKRGFEHFQLMIWTFLGSKQIIRPHAYACVNYLQETNCEICELRAITLHNTPQRLCAAEDKQANCPRRDWHRLAIIIYWLESFFNPPESAKRCKQQWSNSLVDALLRARCPAGCLSKSTHMKGNVPINKGCQKPQNGCASAPGIQWHILYFCIIQWRFFCITFFCLTTVLLNHQQKCSLNPYWSSFLMNWMPTCGPFCPWQTPLVKQLLFEQLENNSSTWENNVLVAQNKSYAGVVLE